MNYFSDEIMTKWSWIVQRNDPNNSQKVCWSIRLTLIYVWVYLSTSIDKYNCCSNPWIYFIVLWTYCSFCYFWIIPLNNPTPLCHYFIREIIHPYSNACICWWLWIIIIALFLFIGIISSVFSNLYTHRRVDRVMKSAKVQHKIQCT